jgi:hypothetical protein
MSSKYQVFVSSTFQDLSDERDLVIKAILEMGHIPVGMEMFSAADEEQWNIIKKQIDQSDYYIVLVAHRYGSCDASGVSYTEKEYDYATSKSIPALGFILEDGVCWPKDKSDSDKTALKRLKAFKEKVKLKPVSFWKNGDDLYGRCSISLMKAFNAYPREGWVRASQVQDTAASKEIVRLSAECAELRAKLAGFEESADEKSEVLKIINILRASKRKMNVWKNGAKDWESAKEVTLYQIFEVLAPEMQVESSLPSIAQFTATHALNVPISELRPTWPTPRNAIRSMLADLAALDCVEPSSKKKPVADKEEYWSLSEFGARLLSQMRRRRLEHLESLTKLESPSGKDSKSDL